MTPAAAPTEPASKPPAPTAAPGAVEPPSLATAVSTEDLTRISRLLVRAVDGCDHACVIVSPVPGPGRRGARRGGPADTTRAVDIAGASDPVGRSAVELMLGLGVARTPDALRARSAIDVTDMRGPTPWPEVASAFSTLGIAAMAGRRLQIGERRVGFLALYSDTPGGLDDVDEQDLATLIELVSGWILSREVSSEVSHLRTALDSARLMGRAIGLVMAQRGLHSADAVAYLKSVSNRMNVRLRDLAAALIAAHDARLAARRVQGHLADPGAPAASSMPGVAPADVPGAVPFVPAGEPIPAAAMTAAEELIRAGLPPAGDVPRA